MNNTKPMTPVMAGVLIASLTIIFALIANVTGSTGAGSLGLLQYLIIIVALVMLVNRYGKVNNYHASFGDLFGYGFKATAVYTLIFLVFLTVFFSLSPEIKHKSLEAAREQMEKNGASDSDIEKSMSIANKYFWIGIVGLSMFFLVLVGAIGSLIGAAVTKKNPHNPIDQLDA